MQVCGSSLVEEVVVDTPKEVYRRFRRLGVYEWSDVLRTAKGDPDRPITAFRFGHTERFERPISWAEMQEVVEAEDGARSQIITITRVSPGCFFRLYRLGTETDKTAP